MKTHNRTAPAPRRIHNPTEAAFIDDSVHNLEGAAALGIFPVLIAVNPAADVETSYLKIRDLRELV